jgi:hypothetical protein
MDLKVIVSRNLNWLRILSTEALVATAINNSVLFEKLQESLLTAKFQGRLRITVLYIHGIKGR